jgi:hypothetical protein
MLASLKGLISRPKRNRRVRTASMPLDTSRIDAVRRWMLWILAAVGLLAAMLACLNYRVTDPAWSTTGRVPRAENWLGATGAWFSDIVYFIAGLSTWWFLIYLVVVLVKQIPLRLKSDNESQSSSVNQPMVYAPWASLLAIVLLVVFSAMLEALRMHKGRFRC